ncbi:FG-GAP-like repeat-containing protein [Mobilicoccus pelagius]|uniref:FG-GAP-like repeat-containing protein n=1 Tax=Mobilicoccus pelagius TaxID=746032 RepID=UPI00058F52FC|nr:FG-GAP-like repeat-containing protein [Mobilicoccus pelagius]
MTTAALLAPAFIALPAQGEPAPKPVETTKETAPLVDPDSPRVGDGDHASTQDVALAKQTSPEIARTPDLEVLGATGRQEVDETLAVIGVTWGGSTPLAVQYRTEDARGWSEWQGIDTGADGEGADAGSGTRNGSDPIVLTGVKAVQARILGAAGESPRNPTLSVIDPGHGDADANTDRTAGAAQAAASRPQIRSRAEWGADESLRRGSPSYGVVRGAIVHHTAGTNNYSPSQVPAILRGIYAFHVKDRGWSDIGYNFLVDKWGRVWEGRYGGTSRALVGAQASGFNSVTMGISVMGDYRQVQPSPAAIDAVTRTIAWKASVHGFDPQGRFSSNGGTYRNVSGHRDVGQTTCPGLIYGYLPAMASRAAALKGSASVGHTGGSAQTGGTARPPVVAAPPAGILNSSDAMLRGSSGALFAVSPKGAAGITYARSIDKRNWRGYDPVLVTQDISGDTFPDLLTLGSRDGRLYVHPGTASGVAGRRSLGGGWSSMSHILAPGDWNGDGRADLLAVQRSNGALYLYPGKGANTFGSRVKIGSAWGVYRHVVAVGDWDGDRRPDLVGVTPGGQAYLYRGDGRGGFLRSARKPLGSVAGYDRFVGMTGSGRLLAIRPNGSAAVLRPAGKGMAATNVAPNFRGLTVFSG